MLLKPQELSLDQKVWEFDFWVTPSIVDIRSTERFQLELRRILAVLDALSFGGNRALDEGRYSADLVDRVFAHLDQSGIDPNDPAVILSHAEEFLMSLSALLFLVTGKSDNNNKCQFPIYLRNVAGWEVLPNVRTKRGKHLVVEENIPRVVDSESYMARIARLYAVARQNQIDAGLTDLGPKLLYQFVNSLLGDSASRNQLSAFLRHYSTSKERDEDPTTLLVPLIIFQVRGSVAASGGHEPEEILRTRMTEWGMLRDIDFNINDVVLDVEAGVILETQGEAQEESQGKTKTRAYDFVLPFRTPTWNPQIFIQAQFYAGDSGSVSHKNVDQTSSSRLNATKLVGKAWPKGPLPRFLEYVDGAGYSASLNGDLKSLLSFADTAGFFQIRSAPIKLRRELQQIGFLTPLEIAHAALRQHGSRAGVFELLKCEGYAETEIQRALKVAEDSGLLVADADRLGVVEAFQSVARLHLLLDLIAREGNDYPSLTGLAGVALVPGYGPYHGLPLSDVERLAQAQFPGMWPTGCMADLQALCKAGWAVLR